MDENASTKPRIKIKICVHPEQRVRQASVVATKNVGCLQELFKNCPKVFICRGEILQPNLSFQFYGIKDGYSIVVMPEDYDNIEFARWASITRDQDNFEDRVGFAVNENTKGEVARLRDLHFDRMEMRSRHFARFIESPAQARFYGGKSDLEKKLNLDWEKSTAPNSEPMPSFWPDITDKTKARLKRGKAPKSQP